MRWPSRCCHSAAASGRQLSPQSLSSRSSAAAHFLFQVPVEGKDDPVRKVHLNWSISVKNIFRPKTSKPFTWTAVTVATPAPAETEADPELQRLCVTVTLTLCVLRCISVSRRRFCWLSCRSRFCSCSCCCLILWTLRSSSSTRRWLWTGRLARRAVSLWRWLRTCGQRENDLFAEA